MSDYEKDRGGRGGKKDDKDKSARRSFCRRRRVC